MPLTRAALVVLVIRGDCILLPALMRADRFVGGKADGPAGRTLIVFIGDETAICISPSLNTLTTCARLLA